MSSTTELSPFDERDFRAIEAAVLETEKGRWFLNEFGRRNRVADTQTLLGALGRLERNLTSQPIDDLHEDPDIAALSNAIDATRADIRSVRNDMLKETAEIPTDGDAFSHLSRNAHQISVDLIATAEALQGTVNTLRSSDGDQAHADTIDGHVHNLFDGGWRQDVLAQRVSKAMGLLEHLDQNLKTLAGASSSPAEAISEHEINKILPTTLEPENLKFFDGDNELFASDAKQSEAEPARVNLEIQKTEAPQDTPEGHTATTDTQAVTAAIAAETAPEPDPQPCETEARAASGPEPEHETAAVVAEPIESVEPKVVVIRRGKSADDTTPATHESVSEDNSTTPSETEEKQPEVVTAVEPEAAEIGMVAPTEEPAAPHEPEVSAEQPADVIEPVTEQLSAASAEPETIGAASEAPAVPEKEAPHAPEPSASSAEEVAAETPAEQSETAPQAGEDKERIVVIRRSTSEEAEIPFAEYLGLEPQPEPEAKAGSSS